MKKIFSFLFFLIQVFLVISNEPDGALLRINFDGIVGYLLDEIPTNLQDEAINYIRDMVTDAQWRDRAELQIKHTIYRQVYRQVYFEDRLQLTLPPLQVWDIKFSSKPYITRIDGHRYVARDYRFNSVLIGRADTINASEPLLEPIGGIYNDIFIVPADPEHVFQRIGYACADEGSFSLDTVNSENYWSYHDQECDVEPYTPIENRTYEQNLNSCHWTSFPNRSCRKALKDEIGLVKLDMTWKRIKYDRALANKFRFGEQSSLYFDIVGVKSKLVDEINVGYKYFSADSCTLNEGGSKVRKGCIGAPGWRQLIRFTSSSINVGQTELILGDVFDSEYIKNGIFEYSGCHLHYHFAHYENYAFGSIPASKTGFCLQTTWRYHNNEYTPFSTPFGACTHQGFSVGWGDDYYQGLDCQWIDVTDVRPGKYDLKVISNPDNFLCEGQFDLNSNGSFKWIKTEFNSSDGRPVYRQSCKFSKNYDKNNIHKHEIGFKGDQHTLVTEPCKRRATLSSTKDCGFKLIKDNLRCTPNKQRSIRITNLDSNNAVVVRLCETSAKLGHSTFCEYISRLANEIILPQKTITINFKCPSFRDSNEPGGYFSILTTNLLPNQKIPNISFL